MNLLDLPPEILLTVLLYLETKFILCTLSQVCKLFYHLTAPESTWKTRFAKLWSDRTTNNECDYLTSWKKVCIQHEDFDKHWLNPKKNFHSFNLKRDFPIDSVLLMNSGKTLLCGSRDRTISIWDIQNIAVMENLSDSPSTVISEHNGWIWSLVGDPVQSSRFCSGSWDFNMVVWDLADGVRKCDSLCLGTAPLCMSWREDMIVTGCYDKTIRLVDPRVFKAVSTLENHTRSVLCLYVDDNFITSGSEDKTLSVYDKKAGKVFQTIKLPSPAFSLNKWSDGYNLLRVGGRNGQIHVFDTTANSHEFIKTVTLTGHKQRISDIVEFKGALLTASADKTLQVHEPSVTSQTKCILDERTAEVTRLSTCKQTLASASSDGGISLWRVREESWSL